MVCHKHRSPVDVDATDPAGNVLADTDATEFSEGAGSRSCPRAPHRIVSERRDGGHNYAIHAAIATAEKPPATLRFLVRVDVSPSSSVRIDLRFNDLAELGSPFTGAAHGRIY